MDDVDVARMQLTDEAMTVATTLIGGDGPAGPGYHSAVSARPHSFLVLAL